VKTKGGRALFPLRSVQFCSAPGSSAQAFVWALFQAHSACRRTEVIIAIAFAFLGFYYRVLRFCAHEYLPGGRSTEKFAIFLWLNEVWRKVFQVLSSVVPEVLSTFGCRCYSYRSPNHIFVMHILHRSGQQWLEVSMFRHKFTLKLCVHCGKHSDCGSLCCETEMLTARGAVSQKSVTCGSCMRGFDSRHCYLASPSVDNKW
jgi:hypothetical protein